MNIEQLDLYSQIILSLAALVMLSSFIMLGQGRLLRLVFVFALQGFMLTLVTVIAAYSLSNYHLYVSATITLLLKVILIPSMLRRHIFKFKIHRNVEAIQNKTAVMMGGASLVIFSYYVLFPIMQQHSTIILLNALALSLAVILLGILLMISHRQAIAHVVGFMSIENGLFLAAIVSTRGMPMVVELGVAFDVLVAAVLFGIFFLQINKSIDSLDVDQLNRLSEAE